MQREFPRSRVGRKVTWQMSQKYAQGYTQGAAEQQAIDEKRFHTSCTFREIAELILLSGRIGLRRNVYPMVYITLDVQSDEFYYLRAIYEKHRWSRFQQWSGGAKIQLIWEGVNAQQLIRRILRYIDDGDVKARALKGLQWLSKKGGGSVDSPEEHPENLSAW